MKKESLKSSISNILKKTYLYRNVYHPYVASQVEASVRRRHSLLLREGATLLYEFIRCCTDMQIPYWLEFGTLLGAYRDGAFIQNDTDLDVGAYLQDARRLNQALTQAGFRLVREFHVVGENGLEQTYEYHELTIDVMYFYEQEGYVWCNGVVLPKITHKHISWKSSVRDTGCMTQTSQATSTRFTTRATRKRPSASIMNKLKSRKWLRRKAGKSLPHRRKLDGACSSVGGGVLRRGEERAPSRELPRNQYSRNFNE